MLITDIIVQEVDTPQRFPSRKQRSLRSGNFPEFTPLWRGLSLQQHESSCNRELAPPASLQPPSPHGGLRKEAACLVAVLLFPQVWEIDYRT